MIEDMAKVTDDGVDTTDTRECHMSRLEYLTLEDNNMALSPEEKLELVALEIQNDTLVAAVSNFLGWVDAPDDLWGGVPETPEMEALRAALEQVK